VNKNKKENIIERTTMTNASTNPFEDVRVHVPTNNPFDDPPVTGDNDSSPFGAAKDDDDMPEDLPVEASWQYLGDLPYRRIPIYDNISWNHQGLATVPINSTKHHKGMDAREWLATSTTTKVVGCPHGGPIASITLPILGTMPTAELRIMTNSGSLLSKISVPPVMASSNKTYTAGDVLSMGFTDRTILVVVLKDSLCLTYDLRGQAVLPPFHVLPGTTELILAQVFEGGVAVLSTKMEAAIVEFLDDHDDVSYANGSHLGARRIHPSSSSRRVEGTTSTPPHYAIVTPLPSKTYASENKLSFVSIAVLTRFHTISRHPEVFLATSDNSVVVLNTATTVMTDVNCRARIQSPIVSMSFAPNGRFLACFTQNSILTVISTSFETKVLDFDTSEGSSSPPLDMQWCGEDSVVLHWKKLGVLMVGPYGDWLRFPFDNAENLYIIPEVDCCRVITDHSVELLQRVPPVTAALMRIGSIEPSAMLLDASDAFEMGSPASDEAARAIKKTGLLMEAVETCTEAATKEFDVGMQKRLLKAASYGMHFSYKDPTEGIIMGGSLENQHPIDDKTMPSETAIKFTTAARTLRILNALRDPSVGFILTAAQFDQITPTGVVARLVAMKRPALASSISGYLGLPKSVQLFARASKAAAFVASDKSKSDAETAEAAIRIINENIHQNQAQNGNSGAYASVALAANRAGRAGVANLLLMLESSVADKVPALIATGSFADAMAVATSARDAEFIFFTLMECEKACMANATDPSAGQNAFLGTVISKFTPEGFNTLRQYLETMPDVKNVMNLLLRAQQSIAAGSTIAKKAMEVNTDASERLTLLVEASRIYGLGKDTGFHKTCIDDHLELLKDQETLRKKYNNPDVAPSGLSVTQTINAVIRAASSNKRESNKLLEDADKIARKFRVPEKRMWHIKVKAFSESEQWPQLRILSDSKAKSPIGFKPFAMAAIRGKQSVGEIMRYIDRVSGSEERYDLFCEAGLWKKSLG